MKSQQRRIFPWSWQMPLLRTSRTTQRVPDNRKRRSHIRWRPTIQPTWLNYPWKTPKRIRLLPSLRLKSSRCLSLENGPDICQTGTRWWRLQRLKLQDWYSILEPCTRRVSEIQPAWKTKEAGHLLLRIQFHKRWARCKIVTISKTVSEMTVFPQLFLQCFLGSIGS